MRLSRSVSVRNAGSQSCDPSLIRDSDSSLRAYEYNDLRLAAAKVKYEVLAKWVDGSRHGSEYSIIDSISRMVSSSGRESVSSTKSNVAHAQ
jgi:hypothetical protein